MLLEPTQLLAKHFLHISKSARPKYNSNL